MVKYIKIQLVKQNLFRFLKNKIILCFIFSSMQDSYDFNQLPKNSDK